MADLFSLAAYAEIFGAVTVVGGLLFAGIQIRALGVQRRDAAAMMLLNSFSADGSMAGCLRAISAIPEEDALEYIQSHPEVRAAIDRIYPIMEGMGSLVFHRQIPLAQAAELYGDVVSMAWNRLEPMVLHDRAEAGREGPYEWFEWLVHQIRIHHPVSDHGSALQRHRGWKP